MKGLFILIIANKRLLALLSLFILLQILPCQAQRAGLKTNALCWGATTPNVGVELGLSPRTTLNVAAAYNPWNFSRGRKMHLWAVQPALRYWFCQRFEGHFVGVHAHAAQYYGGFKQKLYYGYLAGGGISYGYAWLLSPHWNVEAEIGIGYARLWYKEGERIYCEKCSISRRHNYWGPTVASLSVAYVF